MEGEMELESKGGKNRIEKSKINGVMMLLSSWSKAFMIDNIFISSFLFCDV